MDACDCTGAARSVTESEPSPPRSTLSSPEGKNTPITGDLTGVSAAEHLLGEQAVLRHRFRRHLEAGERALSTPGTQPVHQ
jgi:hypothetical protein